MLYPFREIYRITSTYGTRVDPISGNSGSQHNGLDLVCANRNIIAVADGVIAASNCITDPNNVTSQWGNYVCLLTTGGELIYHCHLAERSVIYGQKVKQGDKLGVMGTTGRSTGVHLHFEVRNGTVPINAADYLGIKNKVGVAERNDNYMTRDEILTEIGDEFIKTFDDLPDWAKPEMRKLLDNGIINGGTTQAENPDDVNMYLSDVKTVIICGRILKK